MEGTRKMGTYEIKRDTACFSDHQWYIDIETHGVVRPMFSTQKDAEAALSLGGVMASQERDRIWEKINEIF